MTKQILLFVWVVVFTTKLTWHLKTELYKTDIKDWCWRIFVVVVPSTWWISRASKFSLQSRLQKVSCTYYQGDRWSQRRVSQPSYCTGARSWRHSPRPRRVQALWTRTCCAAPSCWTPRRSMSPHQLMINLFALVTTNEQLRVFTKSPCIKYGTNHAAANSCSASTCHMHAGPDKWTKIFFSVKN